MPPADVLSSRTGEAAAFATSVCWAITPFFFATASRRMGAFPTNAIRLCLASLLLGTVVAVAPPDASPPWRQAALLGASGVVGLALGDAALFESLVILGPRRAALLMALAPVYVAVLGLPLLGEGLSAASITGMAMTLGGVAWVVMERVPAGETRSSTAAGVVLGALAALGQAGGAMLAKAGLGDARPGSPLAALAGGAGALPVTPLFGTFLRMVVATATVLAFAGCAGRMGGVAAAARDRRGMAFAAGGAVFGPFLGVWLSLVAFHHTAETAVAQTIMAFSPVLVLVIARVVHHERATARAWIGSLVAIAGVAVLAFRREL